MTCETDVRCRHVSRVRSCVCITCVGEVRCEVWDRGLQSDIAQRQNKILIHGLHQNDSTIVTDSPNYVI